MCMLGTLGHPTYHPLNITKKSPFGYCWQYYFGIIIATFFSNSLFSSSFGEPPDGPGDFVAPFLWSSNDASISQPGGKMRERRRREGGG